MRWRLVVIAIAVGIAAALSACGGNDDDRAAAEVFRFADDDLCEWVSEAEVAEFVAAEFDWDGTAVKVPPERGGCDWELTGAGFGYVSASDVRQWRDFGGNLIDPAEMFGQFADFDPENPDLMVDSGVVGHPALSEGVVVYSAGFGQFVFWVPPLQEYLGFGLAVPGENFETDVFSDKRFLGVADRIINELGWMPDQ